MIATKHTKYRKSIFSDCDDPLLPETTGVDCVSLKSIVTSDSIDVKVTLLLRSS
jgi:hypothetical protein